MAIDKGVYAEGGVSVVCRDVGREYRTSSGIVQALAGVDGQFRRGEITAIVGPSGSGKSTLLRILAALDRPSSGSVQIDGWDIGALRGDARRRLRLHNVGYLFQNPADNLLGYLTAAEHISFAARLRRVDPNQELALLDRLGLTDRAAHLPSQLSGGEQQLVAFAAAVVGRPAIVIADEPTAELDAVSAAQVVEAVGELRGVGVSLVIATHDPDVLAVADRLLELRHGLVERYV
jgi:ABC-type lipoprotein export system ATPase subunit